MPEVRRMTPPTIDEAIEEAMRTEAKYKSEAAELCMKICKDGNVGGAVAVAIFREMVTRAELFQTCVRTLQSYIHDWIGNFRENFKRGYIVERKEWLDSVIKPTSTICVGAGPSLTDEQILALKDYKGTIICVQKSLERMLRLGVTPTIVTVLHSTTQVLPHFANDIVRERLKDMHIIIPSTMHPEVSKEIIDHSDPEKTWWFHASESEEILPNYDVFMNSMVPLATKDCGANVGIWSIGVSDILRSKVVGMLALEHCLPMSTIETNEQSLQSIIFYAPEDEQKYFCMDQVFRTYVKIIMDWYANTKHRVNTYNLTPTGLIYMRRATWIPYMELREFIQKANDGLLAPPPPESKLVEVEDKVHVTEKRMKTTYPVKEDL